MARFYETPKLLGPVCSHCKFLVPTALGTNVHPCCGPEIKPMLLADRVRQHDARDEARRARVVVEINKTGSR